MILIEATIEVAGSSYQLVFNAEESSRWLVTPVQTGCIEDCEPILIFDSGLGVHDTNGKVGDLAHIGGRWYFMRNPLRSKIDTGVAGPIGYSTILRAEIFVAQKHLERLARERAAFTHAFDTEGGLID